MTSPAKFKKDKEIIAEYDTQVKGKERFYFHPFTASLPGDCRSFCSGCLGGEEGNHLQIAWNLQGFFSVYKAGSGLQRRVRPHGAGPALVVPFLRYQSERGFFFNGIWDFFFFLVRGDPSFPARRSGFACEI